MGILYYLSVISKLNFEDLSRLKLFCAKESISQSSILIFKTGMSQLFLALTNWTIRDKAINSTKPPSHLSSVLIGRMLNSGISHFPLANYCSFLIFVLAEYATISIPCFSSAYVEKYNETIQSQNAFSCIGCKIMILLSTASMQCTPISCASAWILRLFCKYAETSLF